MGFPCVPLRPCGSAFSHWIRNAGSESPTAKSVSALSETGIDLPLPDALYHKHDGFLTQAEDWGL
jgi:hypothetical protein